MFAFLMQFTLILYNSCSTENIRCVIATKYQKYQLSSSELNGWRNRIHHFYDRRGLVRTHNCRSLRRGSEPVQIHHAIQCNRCGSCHRRSSTENAMTNDEPMKIGPAYAHFTVKQNNRWLKFQSFCQNGKKNVANLLDWIFQLASWIFLKA